MQKFVILGGGTAGWLTALYANKFFPYCEVVVVASSNIGILGAGEGTTPHFVDLMSKLDIPVEGIFANADATRKMGIVFTDWRGDGDKYTHPFWDNKFALHFNAHKLANHLQSIAIERGVKYIDDEMSEVISTDSGDIKELKLQSGSVVDGNFFFDCSGFHRLLIGKHFGSQWNSYAEHLPCKRAIPFFVAHDNTNLPEYTEAIALKSGWMWKIPVKDRYGCGYVFDSDFITDEQAVQELEEYLGHKIEPPRIFNFSAGAYDRTWIKNCIAIGLSAGFTEPLEATSIWIAIVSLYEVSNKFAGITNRDETVVDSYNSVVTTRNYDVVDFLQLHYLTTRKDSPFWNTFTEKNKITPIVRGVLEIDAKTELEMYHLEYLQATLTPLKRKSLTWDISSWNTILRGIK